jgi:hypothetical protein
MLAKEESWTLDDAVLAGAHYAASVAFWAVGSPTLCPAVGVEEVEFLDAWLLALPHSGAEPPHKYVQLGLRLLDLVRSDTDSQPEAILAGAWFFLSHLVAMGPPAVAASVWEAGCLEVYQASIARFNPMERVSRTNLVAAGIMDCMKNVMEKAQQTGTEVVTPLLNAGAVDSAIAILTAYQLLGNPDEASALALLGGSLLFLEHGLSSPKNSELVVAQLRSAGVASFRYLLDNPLSLLGAFGVETGVQATRIAAVVRGTLLPRARSPAFCLDAEHVYRNLAGLG